jgi:hypothetical protein
MNQHWPHQVQVFFYSLFWVVFEKIWEMVKTTAPYQIFEYKTLVLVVESELISRSDHYDLCPTSISRSSNLVLAQRTHFRAREQPPTCVSVHNVDENEEEEEWHLMSKRMTSVMQ